MYQAASKYLRVSITNSLISFGWIQEHDTSARVTNTYLHNFYVVAQLPHSSWQDSHNSFHSLYLRIRSALSEGNTIYLFYVCISSIAAH